MTKVGLIQTIQYGSNQKGIESVSKRLRELGKQETEIVCLPEQWLKNNKIEDFNSEFVEFMKIAQEYSMTVITGAFYEVSNQKTSIVSPIIGPNGEIIGKQEKIHPFDYEKDTVRPGTEAKIFDTACKFGVVICYDMVFPNVSNILAKKGAKILFSPSRIVKRGIQPWQMYVQVRALENRIPIIAANVEDDKFGGNSMIVDMQEDDRVMNTKIIKLNGETSHSVRFDLEKYEESRMKRFSDWNKFQ
ncbi:MAG: carbon-nitrogen hydrolase family protein [Nitrosopumilus sp.]|jgi:predicted amidohydrolase|nr:carbon-nitrogen hydrolase family protein [Nitrosopumilus sp.]MBT3956686.1 carbon-nitrogen hydrolase family protein [Nitrosopumilus sp.]MBT4298868.1 carbon-nitrogen hydrolase family protein [Nitrosopumilus sp.]MBT4535557.1 carbon-nitrogen hydrolase family protein [Nitrosopumilus sp.]MBT5278428.1 carbon-nitrogen hydrolase family protein [Nitrosopumilus sp.]